MPRRKSADAIREQTNNICRMAVDRLKDGTMCREVFCKRITAVSNIEKVYMENIHRNPLYILEVRKHSKNAEKMTFSQSEYMRYESIPRA